MLGGKTLLLRLTFLSTALAQQVWRQTNGPASGYVTGIATSPTGEIFTFAESGGLFYSSDTGKNWSYLGHAELEINSLTFDSKGNLFGGSWNYARGLYRSTDQGVTWSNVLNAEGGM